MNNQNQTEKKNDRAQYGLAIRIAGDFGVSIAVPALIAAYLGQKLDERLGTQPIAMIILLILAMALTAVIIVRKAETYAKEYNELNN
ncbi:AtpZ/AtpI family protein [Candidatus Uhrbacteria bacterium]|jgi:F0F1-type ATP synthase assembly protein I|nr:AtpZ/AtpI family protein [Candidatus Uhrbacteria bacterium]